MITSALSSAKTYILDFKLENRIVSGYLHLDVSQGNPYSISVNFNAFSLEPPKTALALYYLYQRTPSTQSPNSSLLLPLPYALYVKSIMKYYVLSVKCSLNLY